VVTLDWLEDSMTKKRRLPEREYSLDQTLRKEREVERRTLKAIKGAEQAERAVDPSEVFSSLSLCSSTPSSLFPPFPPKVIIYCKKKSH